MSNFAYVFKVHIFWECHKILRNLHRRYVLCSASQIYGGDFAQFCGLLRMYELYGNKHCKDDWIEIRALEILYVDFENWKKELKPVILNLLITGWKMPD